MASHAIEFEGMQLYAPILYVLVFLLIFNFFLILRRRAIARRSGGPFFAPFHINHGIFLHSCAFVFQPSYDPIERDEADNLLIAPWSRWWWESLRFLYRTQKWEDHSLLFW